MSDLTIRSSVEMVKRCFRFQNPDAFGRPPAEEGIIPHELRYGRSEHVHEAPAIPEEPTGAPDFVRLDPVVYP